MTTYGRQRHRRQQSVRHLGVLDADCNAQTQQQTCKHQQN